MIRAVCPISRGFQCGQVEFLIWARGSAFLVHSSFRHRLSARSTQVTTGGQVRLPFFRGLRNEIGTTSDYTD